MAEVNGKSRYSTLGVKLNDYDLIDFPDLGSAPDMIDCTTCSDDKRCYIPGLQSFDNFVFTALYTGGEMVTMNPATSSPTTINVTGPNGTLFSCMGYINTYLAGGGVNEVLKMKIAVTPTSFETA